MAWECREERKEVVPDTDAQTSARGQHKARPPAVMASANRPGAYAPEGKCVWCDRRRKMEAARVRRWRARERGDG